MIVEYDPAKDEANRIKHGVFLGHGAMVFDDPDHIIVSSLRPIDGEERFKAIGRISGRTWTAVFVERGAAIRLISVRRSNEGEQRYHAGDPR